MPDRDLLITELAEVYGEKDKAQRLLERAGLPHTRIRPWGDPVPLDYWRAVVTELDNGLVLGGLAGLFRSAADEYPGNSVFVDAARGDLGSSIAEPEPVYLDARTRELSEALDQAYTRLEETKIAGRDTTQVLEVALNLRRKLRESGLRAGDFLADGRYRLIVKLGQGGFAEVWKAYDRTLRILVAVKVLHLQYGQDRTRRERFLRGARQMAKLDHPGIVRVLGGVPKSVNTRECFFAMECLEGGDLRKAVLDGKLGRVEALERVLEVGEALAAAHAAGIVHRDVKPANLLLSKGLDRAKLADFDLVRAVDTTGGTRTQGMGSFLYAAPEMMASAKTADARADVYGLAMTAIFVLYGGDLPHDVLRDASGVVGRLDVPDRVRATLAAGVAWERSERTPTVEMFCAELRDALAPTPTLALTPTPAPAPAPAPEPVAAPPRSVELRRSASSSPRRVPGPSKRAPREPSKTHRGAWLLVVAGVAVVLGSVGWIFRAQLGLVDPAETSSPAPPPPPAEGLDTTLPPPPPSSLLPQVELTANDDAFQVDEDGAATVGVASNDTTLGGTLDLASLELVDPPAHGRAEANDDGTVRYQASKRDYHGNDRFTYRICAASGECAEAVVKVEVRPLNDPPVAIDDALELAEDATARLDSLLANDVDVDGDRLRIESIGTPRHGTIKDLVYTPTADYFGEDLVSYRVCDPDRECHEAEARITVSPRNDPPRLNADRWETAWAAALRLAVLANDTAGPANEGDTLRVSRVGRAPQSGRVTVAEGGTELEYRPAPGFAGTATFSYIAVDSENAEAEAEVTLVITQAEPEAGERRVVGGVRLRYIPAGSFQMGSPTTEAGRSDWEGPQHTVTFTNGFWMSETEVTQQQWREVMRNNPSHFSTCGADCPVETVNWYEAVAFTSKLSRQTGLEVCVELDACNEKPAGQGIECSNVTFHSSTCNGFRLPTEAEWEYAARAETTTRFWSGDREADLNRVGWVAANSETKTHPVGQKAANAWGLFDVHGNVWEWTLSPWTADYSGREDGVTHDPLDMQSADLAAASSATRGARRVWRGGGYWNVAWLARSAYRYRSGPGYRVGSLGFRVVLPSVPPRAP